MRFATDFGHASSSMRERRSSSVVSFMGAPGIPDVCVARDDSEGPLAPAADEDRWPGILGWLGLQLHLGRSATFAKTGVNRALLVIARFYGRSDTGINAVLLLQVIVVATIGFLWFIGVVRGRLGEHEPKLFGTVFLGGSLLMARLVFIGTAALAAPSVLVQVGGRTPYIG